MSKLSKQKNTKKRKKIVAVISCRIDSKRLFGKPLQRINGRTILEMLLLQLKKSKLIEEIVLAISKEKGNEVFQEFAKRNNLRFVLGDDLNVLQRIIKAAKKAEAQLVFRVTPEDPFKHWEIFDIAINSHIKNSADLTYPKFLPEGSGFEIVNLNSLMIALKNGTKEEHEHVTLYLYNQNKNFKINHFEVEKKFRRPELRFTVDNPEDLLFIREIMKKLPKKIATPRLEDIIKVITINPKLLKINKKFSNKNRKWL